MARIGHVPEIIAVKNKLNELKANTLIRDWELPYENLLTRLTAAIFFVDSEPNGLIDRAWSSLSEFPNFRYRENSEKKLSQMQWRLEFNTGTEAL